ncbi:hypothetical protein ACLMJK_007534 [Lecanora helva]
MSKILAVFGATGTQGSSVINSVLNDSELSQTYKIRAITRDVNSEKSKQLAEKVEVAQVDVDDRTSLETAFTGVHTVFLMTVSDFDFDNLNAEYDKAKTITDVAVETGVQYIVFSTLPPVAKISGGKFTKVSHFDSKERIEQYIRGLPIKSAFFSPGSFMENFHQTLPTFIAPRKAADGSWALSHYLSPKARLPLINTAKDTGKFIGAILAEPDKFEGKTFSAAAALYSLDEIAAAMTKATGKDIVYKQTSLEEYRQSLPFAADLFVEVYGSVEEFGYYGPDSENQVAWAAENARGKVTILEEFLKAHPLQLR